MNEIINLGKIPNAYKLNYVLALKKFERNKRTDSGPQLLKELEVVVRQIEKEMNIQSRIKNYIPSEWKYMIDDNYNFWIMKNSYIDRNFIIKNN